MNSTQEYTYCVITANRPIGKTYTPDLEKTALPIAGGKAEIFTGSIEEIAADLAGFSESECLTVGVPSSDCYLTTKNQERSGQERKGLPVLARSDSNWHWPEGPGLLVFDHDPDHWLFEPLTTMEAVVKMVGKALGAEDMWQFDFIAQPSSSSHIWLDDAEVVGLRGVHVYVGVKDLSAIDGDALMSLALANNLGCGVVSKSGTLLKRTVFDSAMHKAPNMPVFAGPPSFEGEHESRREQLVNRGAMLDLVALQANVRQDRAEAAWTAIKMAKGGEIERVRQDYDQARIAEGLTPEAVAAARRGELPGSWPLIFDDGTKVKIWQVMLDPKKYNGRADVRDPLEPDYGESKAKIYIDAGQVIINSFAHGGIVYRAFMDEEGIAAAFAEDDQLKEDWPSLVEKMGTGLGVNEVVALVAAAGVEDTKAEIKDRVKRIRRQLVVRQAMAGDWGVKYAYITENSRFINLPTLERQNLITSMGVQAFNILHSDKVGPNGEQPAAFLVGRSAVPSFERVVSVSPEVLGDAVPIVEGALNVWRPGPVITPFDGEPMLWLQLMRHLMPDDEQRENVLDWLAYALQYPGRKCNWQVVMHSQEGMGKDSMLAPLRWGLGQHNCVDVTTPELLADFNSYLLKGSQLLVLQEIDAGHKAGIRNKLKPLAASPPTAHTVNQKGEKPVYVDNVQAVIVFTNMLHPFALDRGDRRWYMINCQGRPLGGDFYGRLWGWYLGGGLQAVAGWLAARDLSEFNPDILPGHTDYKDLIVELSHTNYHMVVRNYLEEHGVQFTNAEYLVEQIMESEVTVKRATMVLSEMGWEAKQVKIQGSIRRVWLSPDCRASNDQLRAWLSSALNLVKK